MSSEVQLFIYKKLRGVLMQFTFPSSPPPFHRLMNACNNNNNNNTFSRFSYDKNWDRTKGGFWNEDKMKDKYWNQEPNLMKYRM